MVKNSRFADYSVRVSDEALVVRGGRNRIEDIRRGIGTHPSGITGVSVESSEGVTIVELSRAIPHRQIGVTTVGEIRKIGDVIRTFGRSLYHATLTGLTPEQISNLLTPMILNPIRGGK
ncbi:MAG: flavoredoxin [Candidatus Poribacteria bacterium]|nr:flavoredoxin [Candidatus Poribacteria bacterium]